MRNPPPEKPSVPSSPLQFREAKLNPWLDTAFVYAFLVVHLEVRGDDLSLQEEVGRSNPCLYEVDGIDKPSEELLAKLRTSGQASRTALATPQVVLNPALAAPTLITCRTYC